MRVYETAADAVELDLLGRRLRIDESMLPTDPTARATAMGGIKSQLVWAGENYLETDWSSVDLAELEPDGDGWRALP